MGRVENLGCDERENIFKIVMPQGSPVDPDPVHRNSGCGCRWHPGSARKFRQCIVIDPFEFLYQCPCTLSIVVPGCAHQPSVRQRQPTAEVLEPPMRFMKNSSIFEAKIAKNLRRSSKGIFVIYRFAQYPAIELKPGDLPVQVKITGGQVMFNHVRGNRTVHLTSGCSGELSIAEFDDIGHIDGKNCHLDYTIFY